MQNNIYIYIAIMVIVTTLIRVIPLTLIRKEITNRTLRSFLYYIPYVTLAVMAILDATGSPISAWAALIVAIAAAWMGKSLFFVSSAACIVVFLLELVLC